MARRSNEPNPDQGDLFVRNEQTGIHYPLADSMQYDPEQGPFVNILERNAHMQNILIRLGEMSRTTGLRKASETSFRRGIEDRYPNVDSVVGNAAERSKRRELETKNEYAKAFGLEAMIGSGLISPEDARAMIRKSYQEEFLPTFADSKGVDNRKSMRSWLNFQGRKLSGKRTQRPKNPLPKPPKVV